MITEDYVSFETAKLLKEKGFDLSEFHGKWAIDYDNVPRDEDTPEGEIIIAEWHYPLITLQMAMKWLRINHLLFFDFYHRNGEIENGKIFQVGVYEKTYDDTYTWRTWIYGETPEETYENAIKYCLENLI